MLWVFVFGAGRRWECQRPYVGFGGCYWASGHRHQLTWSWKVFLCFFKRKFRLKKISSFERQSAVYTLHMLKQLVQLQRQCRLLPKTRKRQSLLATPIVFVPVRFSGHAQSCKSAKMLSKYIDVVYRPGLNPSKSHSSMAKWSNLQFSIV